MTEEERIHRAKQAELVLDNQLFIEAFEHLRDGCIKELEAANLKDKEKIETLTQALQMIKVFKKYFTQTITDGKFAEVKLKERRFKGNVRV